MKKLISISLFFVVPACFAQRWDFGASAGGSFVNGVPVTVSNSSATAGFKPGAMFGGFLGQDLYKHIGGEIRYGFLMGDSRIQSGGQEAVFGSNSHVLHYDLLIHTGNGESRTQMFAAVGGGMKIFRGTGAPHDYQPLSQYVYLTKTQEVKPMGSVGAGVRLTLTPRMFLRLEVRDYITPFPEKVITLAPGAQAGSIMHNIVPMATLGFLM